MDCEKEKKEIESDKTVGSELREKMESKEKRRIRLEGGNENRKSLCVRKEVVKYIFYVKFVFNFFLLNCVIIIFIESLI